MNYSRWVSVWIMIGIALALASCGGSTTPDSGLTLDPDAFRAALNASDSDCIAKNAPGFPSDEDLLLLLRIELGESSADLVQQTGGWGWMASCDELSSFQKAIPPSLYGEFPPKEAPFGVGNLPDYPSISADSLEYVLDGNPELQSEQAASFVVAKMLKLLPDSYQDRRLRDADDPLIVVYEPREGGSLTGVGTQWAHWISELAETSHFTAREALYVDFLTRKDKGLALEFGIDGEIAWMHADSSSEDSAPYPKALIWHKKDDAAVMAAVGADDIELNDMIRLLSEGIEKAFPEY